LPFAETYYSSDVYNHFELLTPEEQAAIKRLRPVLDNQVKPHINEYWEAGEFPTQIIEPLVSGGFMNPTEVISVGARPSGLYGGFRNFELARTDVSTATFYNAVSGLWRTTINLGGSPEQAAKWDPLIATFDFTGVFGLTEPEHGSDIAGGLATTAVRNGETWTLNGSKRWIGGCSLVTYLAIFARDEADGKVKGFLVEKDAPGITLTKMKGKTSLRLMQNFDIEIKNVSVSEDMRLQNINSFADVAGLLRNMRSDVAWIATGAQAGAYEAAVNYVKEREQFGKPIASFQLIQEKLAHMLANVTASLSMVVRLTQQQDEGVFIDENSAMAKMHIAKLYRETAALAREVVGGNGILLETDVARFHADAEAVYSYEGTHEINSLILGRAITGVSSFR